MNFLKKIVNFFLKVFDFKKKPLVISRVLLPLNVENLNGRVYFDNDNLRLAIADFNTKVDKIGVVFGELGHSADGSIDLRFSNVSHSVKDVRVKDNNVIGTITILNTPMGNKLRKLLKSTVFRPRSVGRVQEDGSVNIERILTFDAISKEEDSFKKIE